MFRKFLRLAYLLSFLAFPLLVMVLASQRLANIPLRLVVFAVLAIGGAWLFKLAWPQQGWGSALLLSTLGYASAYKLASFIPDVSAYPFSLSWSEASRYYYASLWLSGRVYGTWLPPSVLHPSRYLLQAIPFLIPHSPLWFHRLWQVLLWLATSSLTSWLLIRRLALPSRKHAAIMLLCVFLWAFLFLFQGPVYYHLLVMVILLLWGFDPSRFWRTMILVSLASLWAGISRVNWLPVPGMLAAALYVLEVKAEGKSFWKYWLPPAAWAIVGSALAYASQRAYQLWSGNPAAWFGSSFTSDLLWYRLLPNQTFPMGILPSAVLVTLPLLALMSSRLYRTWRVYQPLRLLALAAILALLFLGGILVSVKIGGGSNLHNLDAFLSLLLVISSYLFFKRFVPDKPVPGETASEVAEPASSATSPAWLESLLVAAALIFPLYFSLSAGGALPHHDSAAAQADLQVINSAAQAAASRGGEVLFINQRHLLTFGSVQGVPLVPQDELVFLMEMAMSGNTAYMDAFHADISRQRFALIISEPLNLQYQGRTHGFGEENDAWVSGVSEPVLCYYQPITDLQTAGVIIYTPRPQPCK